MAMQKLTAKFVENIKPISKRQEFCDPLVKGFGLRVSAMGAKTFFIRFRYRGKVQRQTIGTYPSFSLADAREKALEILAQAEKGTLHQHEEVKLTIKEAHNNFIELYAKRETKDWRVSKSRLKKFLSQHGNMKLSDLVRNDIIVHLDSFVAAGTPVQANRVHAALSKFCNWCVERNYIEQSPCYGVKKPIKEKSRTRFLTDEELLKVWEVCGGFGYPFGPLLQILILTGQRRSEVSGMSWSEIDFERSVWVIPEKRAKNGVANSVPLSQAAIDILESLPRFLHSDYVFTTTGKTPVSGLGKYKYRIDENTGVTNWVYHDLRRTVATGMARLGIRPYVIEKILNHVSGTIKGVALVYNRYGYGKEKREALDAWAGYVMGLKHETKRQNYFN